MEAFMVVSIVTIAAWLGLISYYMRLSNQQSELESELAGLLAKLDQRRDKQGEDA